MRRLRQWRALSRGDRKLLVQAAALLVWTRLRLPFIEFRVDPHAADRALSTPSSEAGRARAQAIARLVSAAAARVPVRVTCLQRSLVLWRLLRRQGIACELRLGARAGSAPFGAHAWVQCGGTALGEPPDRLARYSAFAQPVMPAGIRAGRCIATRRAG